MSLQAPRTQKEPEHPQEAFLVLTQCITAWTSQQRPLASGKTTMVNSFPVLILDGLGLFPPQMLVDAQWHAEDSA